MKRQSITRVILRVYTLYYHDIFTSREFPYMYPYSSLFDLVILRSLHSCASHRLAYLSHCFCESKRKSETKIDNVANARCTRKIDALYREEIAKKKTPEKAATRLRIHKSEKKGKKRANQRDTMEFRDGAHLPV